MGVLAMSWKGNLASKACYRLADILQADVHGDGNSQELTIEFSRTISPLVGLDMKCVFKDYGTFMYEKDGAVAGAVLDLMLETKDKKTPPIPMLSVALIAEDSPSGWLQVCAILDATAISPETADVFSACESVADGLLVLSGAIKVLYTLMPATGGAMKWTRTPLNTIGGKDVEATDAGSVGKSSEAARP